MAEEDMRLTKLEEELALVHNCEVDQGAFTHLIVEKVPQTTDFGEIAVKMSFAATAVGKQEVLNALMAECPQLKLKNEMLSEDPYARVRANRVQQEALKGEHKFLFLTKVKK